MLRDLVRLCADEEAASLVEYGILAGALAVPILAFMALISTASGNVMTSTGNALTNLSETGN
jgi:Flp pilus assembly pilin Flp